MKGRTEHELKTNEKIKRLIENYPSYLDDFNISMEAEGLTHNTRLEYVRAVISYLNYLSNSGFDISNAGNFKEITGTKVKKYFLDTKFKENDGEKVEKSGSFITIQQGALTSFFRFLVESEFISKNPFRVDGQPIKIGKKDDSHVIVTLDKDDANVIYKNIEDGVGNDLAKARQKKMRDRDLAIIDLDLHTGLRVSALTEINVDDVDFKNKTIRVIEKGNKHTTIQIDNQIVELLRKWMKTRKKILGKDAKNVDALFISNRKTRITQNAVRDLVKKYSSGIGKNISCHSLRRSFATSVLRQTGSEHIVQTALGHSGDVTDRYLGNKDEEKRAAVNAAREYYG